MTMLKKLYDKLVTKVNIVDTSGFVLKTKYDIDKSELENKIPDTRRLVKKKKKKLQYLNYWNRKKIPSISGLATNSASTAVEYKIPNFSSLVKKQIMAQKLLKMKKKHTDHTNDKYITTPEFNNLAARIFTARLAQANSITQVLMIN